MARAGRGAEQDRTGQSIWCRQDTRLVPEHPWCAALAGLAMGQHGGPQPWGLWRRGLKADVLPGSVRPRCCAGPASLLATVVALTRSTHGVWHSGTLPPLASPPAAFCAVCGAEINPSRLYPPVSRPRQGQADDAPAAPFGPIPAAAQVWLWGSPCSWVVGTSPLCWLCQPGISHAALLRHHCAMSCVPPLCPCSVSCVLAPCPCSTSHVPTACPVSLHPSMWLAWVPALWAAVWELGPSRLAQGGRGECARGPL